MEAATIDRVRMLHDKVLIQELDATKLADRIGSIWLPDQSVEGQRLMMGEVVTMGPACVSAIPWGPLAPGARVVYRRFAYSDLTIGEITYKVVQEDNILGIISLEEAT